MKESELNSAFSWTCSICNTAGMMIDYHCLWIVHQCFFRVSYSLRSFQWNRICTEIFFQTLPFDSLYYRNLIFEIKMRGRHVRLGTTASCLYPINPYDSTMSHDCLLNSRLILDVCFLFYTEIWSIFISHRVIYY